MPVEIKEGLATPEIEAARQAALDALRSHLPGRPAEDLVAVAAYITGELLAYMDAARFTPAEAEALAVRNIGLGNEAAVAAIMEGVPRV